MTTAQQVITGALKDLGVLERGESPTGQESLDALEIMNLYFSALIHDGIDMEWLTLSLNDVVPYPEDQIGPMRSNLAMACAASWTVQPTRELAIMAGNGYKQLQREYFDVDNLGLDTALRPYYRPNTRYGYQDFVS